MTTLIREVYEALTEEASLAIDLPLNAGPSWDALAELDLNRHRENIIEETRRSGAKIEWSKSHREDARYPDARTREESAIATLVVRRASWPMSWRTRGRMPRMGRSSGGEDGQEQKASIPKRLSGYAIT